MSRAYSEHGGLLERIQQQPPRRPAPAREPCSPRRARPPLTWNGLVLVALVAMAGAFLIARAAALGRQGAAAAPPPVTVQASPPPRCSTTPALHQQLPPCVYAR